MPTQEHVAGMGQEVFSRRKGMESRIVEYDDLCINASKNNIKNI